MTIQEKLSADFYKNRLPTLRGAKTPKCTRPTGTNAFVPPNSGFAMIRETLYEALLQSEATVEGKGPKEQFKINGCLVYVTSTRVTVYGRGRYRTVYYSVKSERDIPNVVQKTLARVALLKDRSSFDSNKKLERAIIKELKAKGTVEPKDDGSWTFNGHLFTTTFDNQTNQVALAWKDAPAYFVHRVKDIHWAVGLFLGSQKG